MVMAKNPCWGSQGIIYIMTTSADSGLFLVYLQSGLFTIDLDILDNEKWFLEEQIITPSQFHVE